MEVLNKIKSKLKEISKKEFAFMLIFSVMCVFNFFLFSQFDVILNNPSEFGVTAAEVVWMFIWRAFVILIVIFIALTALRCWTKNGFKYTLATLFGLILAGYIQILFLNNEELMAVNGTVVRASIWQYIFNAVFYLAIVSVPIILVKVEKKKKTPFTAKLALALSLIIFSMQTVGVISVAASALEPSKNNELRYFSIDEQLKLSKNENVIVFILDRFSIDVAEAVFKRNGTKEFFGGFTNYTNNLSEYPQTFPSIAATLTGEKFVDTDASKPMDYLQPAWENPSLFEALDEKEDWVVNGLMDSIATFHEFDDLTDKFDNIREIKPKNRSIKGGEFFGAMLSFAMMRQAPNALKFAFINDKYLDIPSYCIEIKNTPDYFPRTISANSDLIFNKKLRTEGLSQRSDEKNVFSFVHMQASHSPYRYDENLKSIRSSNLELESKKHKRSVSQTHGTFKILNEYFNQMKDMGIYDDATIIITGDHGFLDQTKNNISNSDTATILRTPLLLKEKGKTADTPLVIDEKSELSHRNFVPTILELIGESSKKTARSYFDVINGVNLEETEDAYLLQKSEEERKGVQTRYYYIVRWMNLSSCKYYVTYRITGDARKIDNWEKMN